MAKNFWNSKHRWAYVWIALKHWTTPSHVFKLAHGTHKYHKKDLKVMHELHKRHIVHHHHN